MSSSFVYIDTSAMTGASRELADRVNAYQAEQQYYIKSNSWNSYNSSYSSSPSYYSVPTTTSGWGSFQRDNCMSF